MQLYFFFLLICSWEAALPIHLQCAALRTRHGVISAISHEQNQRLNENDAREDDNKSSEKEKDEGIAFLTAAFPRLPRLHGSLAVCCL